jgi:hypothetical protein
MAVSTSDIIGGFGAALSGTAPQYVAGVQKREELAGVKKQEQMAAREKAMYQDAGVALQLVEAGDIQGIIDLGMDRMKMLSEFGDSNPEDTMRIITLAQRAKGGDRNSLAQLHAELMSASRIGTARGYIAAPERVKGVEVNGQLQNPYTGVVIGAPRAEEVPTRTSKQKEAEEMALMAGPKGSAEYNKVYGEYMNRSGGTTVTVGAEGNYGLPKQLVDQFANNLQAASTSAAAAPQLEMMMELANYTTEGRVSEAFTTMFPTMSDPNTAFNALVYQTLPSFRVPGSGAQSDKDIDVLIKSLGQISASNEVKKLVIVSLQAKNQIMQQHADIAERLFANEITGAQAVKLRRELDARTILSPELQRALKNITGSSVQVPEAARQEGVTGEMWKDMNASERRPFEDQ